MRAISLPEIVIFISLLFTCVQGHTIFAQATGQEYIGLPEDNRIVYIRGLYDGFIIAPFLGAKNDVVITFINCVGSTPFKQLAKMLFSHIANNPNIWPIAATKSFFHMIQELCPSFRDYYSY